MARWQPGTRERLEQAALELFAHRGFDDVTVQDIVRQAGVGKATFFRIFGDKREVLFWGQDALVALFVEGVSGGPAGVSIAARLEAAMRAVAVAFPADRRAMAVTRETVVSQHPDLQERTAAKRNMLRDALREALAAVDVPAASATLGAEIGRAAFSSAYERWARAGEDGAFAVLASEELDALLAAASSLRSTRADRAR